MRYFLTTLALLTLSVALGCGASDSIPTDVTAEEAQQAEAAQQAAAAEEMARQQSGQQ